MSSLFVEFMEGGRCELVFHPLHPGVELFLGIVALCPYSVWMEFFLNAENYRAPGIIWSGPAGLEFLFVNSCSIVFVMYL